MYDESSPAIHQHEGPLMYDGVADGGAWESGPLRTPVARLCENAKMVVLHFAVAV